MTLLDGLEIMSFIFFLRHPCKKYSLSLWLSVLLLYIGYGPKQPDHRSERMEPRFCSLRQGVDKSAVSLGHQFCSAARQSWMHGFWGDPRRIAIFPTGDGVVVTQAATTVNPEKEPVSAGLGSSGTGRPCAQISRKKALSQICIRRRGRLGSWKTGITKVSFLDCRRVRSREAQALSLPPFAAPTKK
jgi:hypothetical protein